MPFALRRHGNFAPSRSVNGFLMKCSTCNAEFRTTLTGLYKQERMTAPVRRLKIGLC